VSSFPNVTGYPATVWTAARAALAWLPAQLNANNPSASTLAATTVASTVRNSRDALSAYLYGQSLTTLYDDLSYVLTLPLAIDAGTAAIVTSRIATVQRVAAAAATLAPATVSNPTLALTAGTPAVADPLLIEWCMAFAYEAVPDGLTTAAVASTAQAYAAAWDALLAALEGIACPGNTVDAVEQMALVAADIAAKVARVSISQFSSPATVWNQLVAMPTCLRLANATSCDPTSAASQQIMVLRYVLGTSLADLYTLLISLRDTTPAQIQLVTVRQNDTLMAIAARTLGDFERFTDIAKLNNLLPPYISNTPQAGCAVPGQQLYIPTAGAVTVTTRPASYTQNYLGIDLYYGPLNEDMLPWTGDFATISGYANLSFSLGRRLQTTLGSLIFHGDFGSRIPPEVGKVVVQATSGHLAAYAKSAILSDPRTYQVPVLNVTVQASYAISIEATVTPNGSVGSSAKVNEVLQPQS